MAVNLGYVKSPQGILKILEFVSIAEGNGGVVTVTIVIIIIIIVIIS